MRPIKRKGECEFGTSSGRYSGMEEGRERDGVVLLLSDWMASSVAEWNEAVI